MRSKHGSVKVWDVFGNSEYVSSNFEKMATMGRIVVEEKSGKVVCGQTLEDLDWKIQDFIEFKS